MSRGALRADFEHQDAGDDHIDDDDTRYGARPFRANVWCKKSIIRMQVDRTR